MIRADRPKLRELWVVREAYFLAAYEVNGKEYIKSVKRKEFPALADAAEVTKEVEQQVWNRGNFISGLEKQALLAYEKGEVNVLTLNTEFMEYIARRLDSDDTVEVGKKQTELLTILAGQAGLPIWDFLSYVLCDYVAARFFNR